MNTLQNEYNLIIEGNNRGSKTQLLKQAKNLFPNLITNLTPYPVAITILKNRGIITESKASKKAIKSNKVQDWMEVFKTSINEQLGENTYQKETDEIERGFEEYEGGTYEVIRNPETKHYLYAYPYSENSSNEKGKKLINKLNGDVSLNDVAFRKTITEEVKAIEKETSKEVKDNQSKAYDRKAKDIDNVYGQTFLNGYYTELKDPANKDKTTDQLLDIVAKNMFKDVNYYLANGQFGTKGLGFAKDKQPGLPIPTDIKGDHKSSGYGDLPDGLVAKIKANVKATLGNQEAKTGDPKKVKKMTLDAQSSKGVKKTSPGNQKWKTVRQKLKEGIEETEDLTIKDILNHPKTSHVVTQDEQKVLQNYFKNLDGENIPNIVGKSLKQAALIIGDPDFNEENLQHLIYALYPKQYKPIYESKKNFKFKLSESLIKENEILNLAPDLEKLNDDQSDTYFNRRSQIEVGSEQALKDAGYSVEHIDTMDNGDDELPWNIYKVTKGELDESIVESKLRKLVRNLIKESTEINYQDIFDFKISKEQKQQFRNCLSNRQKEEFSIEDNYNYLTDELKEKFKNWSNKVNIVKVDLKEYEGEGDDASTEDLGYYDKMDNDIDKDQWLELAKYYTEGADNTWIKFLDENSIEGEGDNESWSLDFTLEIPKSEYGNESFEEVEEDLDNDLTYSSHGVEGNPGGGYSRRSISVSEQGDIYKVLVRVRGGLDI